MFINDAIAPIANRVLRKLGIKETTEEKVLLDDPLAPGDEFGPGTGSMQEGSLGLVVGKTYTITTDSGTYQAVCKKVPDIEANYLGNPFLFGLDDTGETFIVVDDNNSEMITAIDFNSGTHIKVSEVTETIHPISDKYLPSGGVKVIDLDTYGTTQTITGVLIELLSANGGKKNGADLGNLFADLNTGSTVRVKFSYPSGIVGENFMLNPVVVDGVTTVWSNGSPVQLSFSCVINNNGTVLSVAVTIFVTGDITLSMTMLG